MTTDNPSRDGSGGGICECCGASPAPVMCQDGEAFVCQTCADEMPKADESVAPR